METIRFSELLNLTSKISPFCWKDCYTLCFIFCEFCVTIVGSKKRHLSTEIGRDDAFTYADNLKIL